MLQKIGIWVPIIGLGFLCKNAFTDKQDNLINIHQFTIAAMLQAPYVAISIGIYLIKSGKI